MMNLDNVFVVYNFNLKIINLLVVQLVDYKNQVIKVSMVYHFSNRVVIDLVLNKPNYVYHQVVFLFINYFDVEDVIEHVIFEVTIGNVVTKVVYNISHDQVSLVFSSISLIEDYFLLHQVLETNLVQVTKMVNDEPLVTQDFIIDFLVRSSNFIVTIV